MARYSYAVIYENNRGESINLTSDSYAINIEPLLDYSWAYATRDRRRGSRVAGFNKAVASKDLTLHILGETVEERDSLIDTFNNVIETDIYDGIAGKIWFDDWYTYGYIVSSKNEKWQYDKGVIKKSIEIVREEETWYHVITQRSYRDKEITEPPKVGEIVLDQSVLYDPYVEGVKSYELVRDTQIVGDTYTLPHKFKKSPNLSSPYDRLLLNKVVGGTLAVNQFNSNNKETGTVSGVTFTNNGDGSWTLNGTASASGAKMLFDGEPQKIINHVYFVLGFVSGGSGSFLGQGGISIDTGNGGIWKNTQYTTNFNLRVDFVSGNSWNNVKIYPQVIDLTQFFCGNAIADYVYNLEQGTAGAGVAWLKQYYPSIFNSYQPYNAGSLESVQTSAHVMRGFNQWDEEWELGNIDANTGANSASTLRMRSKNYIPVLGGTAYYLKCDTSVYNSWFIWFLYDTNKNYLGYITPTNNGQTTLSQDVRYIRFVTSDVWNAQDYTGGICINVSSDRNGEYEPYTQTSYPLDSNLVLRGIPKLNNGVPYYDGDEYKSNGTVTRKYGIVDLGTLNYSRSGDSPSGGNIWYTTALTTKAYGVGNLVSARFTVEAVAIASMQNGSMRGRNDNVTVYFRSDEHTTAADFKAAMSGVYLIYELATPTTETADPYTKMQKCYMDGTEEFVSSNVVLVGNEIQYALNQVLGYDYPYDYLIDTDSQIDIVNPNPLGCNFIITIDGPVTNPYVRIGETVVNVNVEVPDGATLTIDSGAKTIILTMPDGQQINAFGARNPDYYIFQLIETGKNAIVWDGTFTWELQMIEERSEPRWHMD